MKPINREMVEAPTFMTKDPFFIPGYSGYCPQYKFRGIGGTYGHFTNEILTNPPWKSIASVLQKVKPQETPPKPTATALKELRDHPRTNRDPLIYSENMKTGYSGVVPHSDDFQGETFPGNVLYAVSSFNRQQREKRQAMRNIDDKVQIQAGKIALAKMPACIEASPTVHTHGAPLPQTNAYPARYKPVNKFQYSRSPYDMENDDPNKFLKSGHTGHVPLIGEKCGHTRTKLTHDALGELRNGRIYYRAPKADDIITHYDGSNLPPYVHPPPPTRPHSPLVPKITTIDPKADCGEFPVPLGLPTTYRGHVQGLKDVVGMTYGTATRYLNKLRCPNVLNQHFADRNRTRGKCTPKR